MRISGSVIAGDTLVHSVPDARGFVTKSLAIWPQRQWSEATLTCFELDQVLISSAFVAIHLPSSRLLLDQSYTGIANQFSTRFQVRDDRFSVETEPRRQDGRYLVLGGPIDGVWYHWLFNWAPRLLLAKRLRPDILNDTTTRIAVHPRALEAPFVDILECFGLPLDRYVALDPEQDHLLERAVLVSFLDQNKLFPEIILEMRALLLNAFNVRWRPTKVRRIFASRQDLPAPKRRVANFDEVVGPLTAMGFTIISTGRLSPAAQADVFHNARMVLGGHGSDLANLLFCRPQARVFVIEHDFNIRYRLTAGLDYLCEILSLDYTRVRMPTVQQPGSLGAPAHVQINEDFLLDPDALRALLGLAAERN